MPLIPLPPTVTYPGPPPACPSCGEPMVLRQSDKYPKAPFWGCSKYPRCQETHGAHPDGTPLGTPATRVVKQMRIDAHKMLETCWDYDYPSDRKAMYAWLQEKVDQRKLTHSHVAEMDEGELLMLTKLFEREKLHVTGR